MSYQLGVDLGTTYTAAAVFRDGAATIFTLGDRAAAIPSVVLLREDGTILTGDAAERRAMGEPERVVREFKRRLGDTTPIIVGGAPYSAEALSARLLESVVDAVRSREGGEPTRIVVTHPANWGNYKRDLLERAVQMAGVDGGIVDYLSEPEAAALSYAAQERIDPGEVVAVYDLGGGTFDAAILRRTAEGFTVLGKPEGIERLGGIDFDAAVFAHVTGGLGSALAELDHDDPAALAAVARLRQDCVVAKEALSSDTDASIPVLLPNLQTEVRITRQEFESLIRPSLLDSIEAMKRAVRSAGLEESDLTRVLLVGGSSRIPLISLLVTSELGRPVAVDAHPKHAIAIGAAFAASGILDSSSDATAPPAETPAPARGLDPNMTVVAPAHLYNPAHTGRALPVEQAGSGPSSQPRSRPVVTPPAASPIDDRPAAARRGLPIEDRPAAAARPDPGPGSRSLPVENPSSGRSRPLPIEGRPNPTPGPPGAPATPGRPGSPGSPAAPGPNPPPGSPAAPAPTGNPGSPAAPAPTGLPVENPGSGRARGLPVENPGSGRSRALPIEGRPGEVAGRSSPAAPGAPGKAEPVVGRRPPPGQAPSPGQGPPSGRTPAPGSAPPGGPVPGERDQTSLYRNPAEVDRTRVYPGGNPPGFEPVAAAAGSPSQVGRPPQATPRKKRSGALWFLSGVVVIALIVVVVILAGAL